MDKDALAAATAELNKVGDQARATVASAHAIGQAAVENTERAANKAIASAKSGDKSSIVLVAAVAIAVAGLVYGLVHSHV